MIVTLYHQCARPPLYLGLTKATQHPAPVQGSTFSNSLLVVTYAMPEMYQGNAFLFLVGSLTWLVVLPITITCHIPSEMLGSRWLQVQTHVQAGKFMWERKISARGR